MIKIDFKMVAATMAMAVVFSDAHAQDLTEYSDTLVSVSSNAGYVPMTQEEIMFSVRVPEKSGLSDEVASLLENKVVQVLGRCGAGASGSRDVFVVEPMLILNNHKKSEGLVRNVNSITGELSLTAKHRYSDAVLYNVAVPLNAVANGSGVDAMSLLAKSIRPSDAAYVRFVRNARKNAFEYGLAHPEIYEIPELPAETEKEEAPVKPEAPVEPAAPAAPEAPVAPAAPVQTAPSAPVSAPVSKGEAQMYVSDPTWKVEFTGCQYDPISRSIRIGLRITNLEHKQRDYVMTRLQMAMDAEGNKYRDLTVSEYNHSFPYDVPILVYGYIKDVYSNPGDIPFIQFLINSAKVELRNVVVTQQ